MILSRVLVGAAAGFVVTVTNAFVFNPGYDESTFVVGTGVLGAAAGAAIGSCGPLMFLKYFLIGAAAGLVVGAAFAYVVDPANSDSVIGTGLLGAAAGAVIGSCTAAVTLTYRWLGKPPGRSG